MNIHGSSSACAVERFSSLLFWRKFFFAHCSGQIHTSRSSQAVPASLHAARVTLAFFEFLCGFFHISLFVFWGDKRFHASCHCFVNSDEGVKIKTFKIIKKSSLSSSSPNARLADRQRHGARKFWRVLRLVITGQLQRSSDFVFGFQLIMFHVAVLQNSREEAVSFN